MSRYDSLLSVSASTGSLSEYDMIDEIPTDSEILSELDSNSVLSTSDFEGDTPDDSSSMSEDQLSTPYDQDDSDADSNLGGDTHRTFTPDSVSTPSSPSVPRTISPTTPSVVSLESSKDEEYYRSILNKSPSSSPSSLAGSKSTLRIPTASMLLSHANHRDIFNVETDGPIHGTYDMKCITQVDSATDIFRLCSVPSHFHCNSFSTLRDIKNWNLQDKYISLPSLNILGFTTDVNNTDSLSMFRRIAQLLQGYVKYQIKIFVCDKPLKSVNYSGLETFDWYYVNPGATPTLTKLAYDDDPSKCNYDWLNDECLAVLDCRNAPDLMMSAAEQVERSPLILYHSLRDIPTLSFVDDNYDCKGKDAESMYISEYMPQNVLYSSGSVYREPLTWDDFQDHHCYLRQLVSVLYQSHAFKQHEISEKEPDLSIAPETFDSPYYRSSISLMCQGCSVMSRKGPTMVKSLKTNPLPTEQREPAALGPWVMKFLLFILAMLALVGPLAQDDVPQSLEFSINPSYTADGSEVRYMFTVPHPVATKNPDVNFYLSRVSFEGLNKVYSDPMTVYSDSELGTYNFSVPDTERWGVVNASVRIGDAQSEDIVQKFLFFYGIEEHAPLNLSDTLVSAFQYTSQPRPASVMDKVRKMCSLREAKQKSIKWYQQIYNFPTSRTPGMSSDVVLLDPLGTDVATYLGLDDVLAMTLDYLKEKLDSAVTVFNSYWDVYFPEILRLAQEAGLTAQEYIKYLEQVGQKVLESDAVQYAAKKGQDVLDSEAVQYTTKQGKIAYFRIKKSLRTAQDSAVYHYHKSFVPVVEKVWEHKGCTGKKYYKNYCTMRKKYDPTFKCRNFKPCSCNGDSWRQSIGSGFSQRFKYSSMCRGRRCKDTFKGFNKWKMF